MAEPRTDGLNLGNENCKADILGQAYEYLIKKFADLTNKKAGEFYTPRSAVALTVRILAPKAGETIYDPACGTGGMLPVALHHVKEHDGDENLMLGKLHGQEKNLTTSIAYRIVPGPQQGSKVFTVQTLPARAAGQARRLIASG